MVLLAGGDYSVRSTTNSLKSYPCRRQNKLDKLAQVWLIHGHGTDLVARRLLPSLRNLSVVVVVEMVSEGGSGPRANACIGFP